MNMRYAMCLAAILLIVAVGCGGHVATEAVEQTQGGSAAKGTLEEIGNTGVLTSGLMEVQNELDAMKTTDAGKADKLQKELDELQKARDPSQIKSKAKAMAAQL
jgi:hypothetical protein